MKHCFQALPALLFSAALAAQPALAPGSAAGIFPGSNPLFPRGLDPAFAPGLGLLVLAEQRFNPLVQRLLAERSLRALPLYGGQLFYLVPTGTQPQLEEMQIRYLEVLLRERRRSSEDDGVAGGDSFSDLRVEQ